MRASRVRVGRSPYAGRYPSWAGGEKTSLGAPPSREKIVTSQGATLRSSQGSAHPPKTSQSDPSFPFPHDHHHSPTLAYLERLLDGETVEWKTLGEVCDALMLK